MSTDAIWEDFISLNSRDNRAFEVLEAPAAYLKDGGMGRWATIGAEIHARIAADEAPLPRTEDREGYYGDDHFAYWASGLFDWLALKGKATALGVSLGSYLDLGCASGRVIRHAACEPGLKVYGADINRRHVDWCNTYLPAEVAVFQNSSVPSLPLPDASLDLVSAYSVFSHIEAFDTTWLMEIRRVLKPGGIAWVTIHSDDTLLKLDPHWPLYPAVAQHPLYPTLDLSQGMPSDRLVFRWLSNKSYSSNVFYRRSYIDRTWGRIMAIAEYIPTFPNYQDVVMLQKT